MFLSYLSVRAHHGIAGVVRRRLRVRGGLRSWRALERRRYKDVNKEQLECVGLYASWEEKMHAASCGLLLLPGKKKKKRFDPTVKLGLEFSFVLF